MDSVCINDERVENCQNVDGILKYFLGIYGMKKYIK